MSHTPDTVSPSPTLTDMDFESPHFASSPMEGVPSSEYRSPKPLSLQVPKFGQRLTRYLPPNKKEAFIGSQPLIFSDTIRLLKTECPSLLDVPMSDISLHLRFDGETTAAIRGVDFRILPEAWPSAVVDVLPLIHVRAKAPTGMQKGGKKKKTWEDLKREGALLGVQGWTDQVEAGFDKKEAVNGWIES